MERLNILPSLKKLLSKIESLVHQSLRLITGALKSKPTAALYKKVNIPSLEERFLKLSSEYLMKVNNNHNHPVFKECSANLSFSCENWKTYSSPAIVKLSSLLDSIGVTENLIFCCQTQTSSNPPNSIDNVIDTNIPGMDCPKTKMNTQILRQLILAKVAEFCSQKKIFTNRYVSNDGRASIGIFTEWNVSSIGIRV